MCLQQLMCSPALECPNVIQRDHLGPEDFQKLALSCKFGSVDQNEIEVPDSIFLFNEADAMPVCSLFTQITEIGLYFLTGGLVFVTGFLQIERIAYLVKKVKQLLCARKV